MGNEQFFREQCSEQKKLIARYRKALEKCKRLAQMGLYNEKMPEQALKDIEVEMSDALAEQPEGE